MLGSFVKRNFFSVGIITVTPGRARTFRFFSREGNQKGTCGMIDVNQPFLMSATIIPTALPQAQPPRKAASPAFAERRKSSPKKARKQRVEAAFKIVLLARGSREFAGREYRWLCSMMRMTSFSEVCYDKTEMPRYAVDAEQIFINPKHPKMEDGGLRKARFWARV